MSRGCACGALLEWVTMSTGKRMPLDAVPDLAKGNIAYFGGAWRVLDSAQRAAWGGALYTSHFATCPDAAKHRKPRARG